LDAMLQIASFTEDFAVNKARFVGIQ
jgi:hypothetical protein